MELTEEKIKAINKLITNEWQENEQGVFTQPFGIPTNIKEPVIYMRWRTGGVNGGSWTEKSNPQTYKTDKPKPRFKVLTLVLKELKPEITHLQYEEVKDLIKNTSEKQGEGYGNSTDFDIEYIVLSELIKLLKSF